MKRWTDWLLVEGSHPDGPAAGRGLPPRRREVRRGASSRRGSTRTPAAPAAPTPDTSRSRRRCRSSPSARPSMTCWSPPTRARSSPPGCPTTPGTRARSPARRGCTPTTWHPAMEAWGGTQLQTRFEKQSNRPMRPEDYNAWMALRAVGEAATRTQLDRSRHAARLYPRPGLRARRLQGPAGDLPRLGRPAAPADPARRRQRRGLGLAAGRVRPPVLAARHPRHRPPRDRMPRADDAEEPPCATSSPPPLVRLAAPAGAYTVYVSNERGNSITILDSETLEVVDGDPGRPAPARHQPQPGRQVALHPRPRTTTTSR